MRRPLPPAALILAAAALLGSGCIATQRDMLDLSQQTDEVKNQVVELKKTIGGLQANQADLGAKMDQMRSELGAFTENLKDSQSSMAKLTSKIDDLESVLAKRVAALGETLNKQQQETASQVSKKTDELIAAQKAAAEKTASQVYEAARQSLNGREYKAAAEGFEDYLKKSPKGEVADLATFYLGESYYGRKDWESAARNYAIVLDRWPKSEVTPKARLKYAMGLMNLKSHLPEAERYLQSIGEDFPKSKEAAEAAKLLKKFDRTAAPSKRGRR